jgi:CheY-like chemotaxis protein
MAAASKQIGSAEAAEGAICCDVANGDDDPINVEVLRVRLSAQGYEVVTAIDGEEGLQRARELEPDLVLLDVMMPKLDGISVLKELKRTLRFASCRSSC